MRRADRLFQLVQYLRRRGVVTARSLAEELEVSERTIYRDMQHLYESGVPIEAEAGVGYRLRGYDLPPLAFTREELEAVVLGLRIVDSWTDDELAAAARRAIGKIEAVLPEGHEQLLHQTPLHAPKDHYRVATHIELSELRLAIREQRKIRVEYVDAKGARTDRVLRPFGLAFYGPIWILAAWCELRQDYRAFRPDRVAAMDVLDESFDSASGPSMDGFLCQIAERN
ncbi:MAG: YafY family transcriptional regulator [Thermoanaerobaculia bacterium]|nr:YafY family transcriptional regulator [Thermoanaerobaculia bacterium]